jgi:RNA polymerase sigma-70 factor (ECF subfamily)
MTDEQTIEQFKKDDRQAFENIYKEYRQKLICFLKKHNVEDAEDITEDTFVRLWDKRTLIKRDGNLFNYICTIACNIVKNKRDHKDIEQKYLSNVIKQANIGQKSYSPEDELIFQDLLQCTDHVVTKLTKRQREIFHLRLNRKLTYEEIAQKLGIKANTVKSHILHINRILHKYLGI